MQKYYQLSTKEIKLLELAEFAPDLTTDTLARLSGSRPSTVSYTLEKLHERQLIKKSTIIDFFKLGYSAHLIYFSLSATKGKDREAFIKAIIKRHGVAWFGNLVGRFEYGLALFSHDAGEVSELLHSLTDKYQVQLRGKIIGTRIAVHYYGRRYVGSKNRSRKPISIKWNRGDTESVDETDHQILRTISNNVPRSNRDIARTIGGNFSLIDRRIKKLNERKIIAASILSINGELLGKTSYRLLVSSQSLSLPMRNEVLAFAAQTSAVVMVLEALGTWEFEIDVEVSDTKELALLVQDLSDRCTPWIAEIEVLGENEDFRFSFYPF